jgi:hypothetical protein
VQPLGSSQHFMEPEGSLPRFYTLIGTKTCLNAAPLSTDTLGTDGRTSSAIGGRRIQRRLQTQAKPSPNVHYYRRETSQIHRGPITARMCRNTVHAYLHKAVVTVLTFRHHGYSCLLLAVYLPAQAKLRRVGGRLMSAQSCEMWKGTASASASRV